MKAYCYLILMVMPVALPVQAGIFGKRSEPNPYERVPQVLHAVKAEPDFEKRAALVGELGHFDTKAFPEIIPTLIDVLEHDKKPKVRQEAACTLSHMRPICQDVGQALYQSATKDPCLRVRIHSWSALKLYQFHGYTYPKPPAQAKTAPHGKHGPAPDGAQPPAVIDQQTRPGETLILESPPTGPQGTIFSHPQTTPGNPLLPTPVRPTSQNTAPQPVEDGPILVMPQN